MGQQKLRQCRASVLSLDLGLPVDSGEAPYKLGTEGQVSVSYPEKGQNVPTGGKQCQDLKAPKMRKLPSLIGDADACQTLTLSWDL